jgi:hypothetical protein
LLIPQPDIPQEALDSSGVNVNARTKKERDIKAAKKQSGSFSILIEEYDSDNK